MSGTSAWYKIFFFILVSFTHIIPYTHATIARGWDYSLGMATDPQGFSKQGKHAGDYTTLLYTTILQYDRDTAIFLSDDQLVGLAAQAYAEMSELYANMRQSCSNPTSFPSPPVVVAAMAIGNKVYISSSLRSPDAGTVVYASTKTETITRMLNACQSELQALDPSASIPSQHRQNGRCAEVFVIQQYLDHNNGQSPRDLPTGTVKRIAAWGNAGRKRLIAGALDPCGDSKGTGWGCAKFMEHLGINVLAEAVKRYKIGSGEQPPKTDERPVPLDGNINIQFVDAAAAGPAPGS